MLDTASNYLDSKQGEALFSRVEQIKATIKAKMAVIKPFIEDLQCQLDEMYDQQEPTTPSQPPTSQPPVVSVPEQPSEGQEAPTKPSPLSQPSPVSVPQQSSEGEKAPEKPGPPPSSPPVVEPQKSSEA